MKLFSSLRCFLTLAIGGLIAAGGPFVSVDAWGQTPAVTVAPIITTVAGAGTGYAFSGDGGPATSALLNRPWGAAVDGKGNIYISDTSNRRVRKVDTSGNISTIAGTGSSGFSGDGGPATNAQLRQMYGIAVDAAGNIYFLDTDNNRIRKVNVSDGIISTVAGNGTRGFSGDGGPATSASFDSAFQLALDAAGNIYLADYSNHRIRKVNVSTGTISTVAGNGIAGFSGDGGQATNASLNYPDGVAVDVAGNIYIGDNRNNRIRKVNTSGVISTIAGTGSSGFSGDGGPAAGAQLASPDGIAIDVAGNIYFADTGNTRIRKISQDGIISTFAGNGVHGNSDDGGLATSAQFEQAQAVAVDAAGSLYIADNVNNRIRKVESILPFPDTLVGQSSLVQNISLAINQSLIITSFGIPQGEGGVQEFTLGTVTGCPLNTVLAAGTVCTIPVTFTPQYPGKRDTPLIVQTNLTVNSTANIKFSFGLVGKGVGPQVAIVPGVISTIAGNGQNTYSGEGIPATSAGIAFPQGISRDAAGNMYVADTVTYRVRRVDPSQTITTFAGNGVRATTGDGGKAVDASLMFPTATTIDAAGNVYIADADGAQVRKVDINGTITTVAGTPSSSGFSGDNGPAISAKLKGPQGVAVDAAGNLYISDSGNSRIRKVDTNGIITTIAGTGTAGFSGDGGPAITAQLYSPYEIAVNSANELYIADQGNYRVRKVDANGIITTVAGNSISGSSGDGGPATAASLTSPAAVTFDAAGDLYILSHLIVRKVDGNGIISTVAGNGASGFGGDGGPATSAALATPLGIAIDSLGEIFLADSFNSRVRKITTTPAPLSFSSTPIGQNSSPQAVSVSNIGNGELNIGSITFSTADFLFDNSDVCSTLQTLSVGRSCPLVLRFQPQQEGSRSGTATLLDDALNVPLPPNGPGSPQVVQLSGNGLPLATTTVLSLSTSNSIDAATPVTLTANVTPFSAGAVTTTGFISFFDNGVPLFTGSIAVSATGEASFTVPSFAVGTHVLTAAYGGDRNFNASVSAGVTLTVGAIPIAIEVSSSDNPSNYGQTVIFTATVPSGATGTVNFFDGATQIAGPVPISAAKASFATSALALGGHTITAKYSGDGTHATATSGILNQIVNPATLTVTATGATRPYGEPNPTFTYSITGFIGSDTQSVVSGTPQITTTATAGSTVGSYPVSATLGTLAAGSYTFAFVPGTLTVTKATPGGDARTLGLSATCSPNPSVWGQTVTCTATLPANATGQVNFAEGAAMLGTGTIVDERASFTTTRLAVATHSIAANYGGDVNYNGASSAAISQVVNKATLSVIANNQQRLYGQPNPPLTTITSGFVNGDTSAVATGTPVVTTTATATSSPGAYPITVTQGTLAAANYNFVPVDGSLFVAAAAGTVTLTTSAPSVPGGTPVTFTATVAAGATGTVQFYDGATVIGTGSVSAGKAILTTSTLAVGTHSITAVYSGDTNFTTASSTVLTQVITAAPDYNVSSNTPRQLIPPGASATYNIIINSMNAPFTNVVTLTATGLPAGASYTFTSSTVTPGAAGATSSFTVTVPKQTAGLRIRGMTPMTLAVLLLPLMWWKRKTSGPPRLLLWLLLSLTTLGTVVGCGTGGYFSQTEQTHTITVTGTSGSLVRSTTVTLTVE